MKENTYIVIKQTFKDNSGGGISVGCETIIKNEVIHKTNNIQECVNVVNDDARIELDCDFDVEEYNEATFNVGRFTIGMALNEEAYPVQLDCDNGFIYFVVKV